MHDNTGAGKHIRRVERAYPLIDCKMTDFKKQPVEHVIRTV